MLFLKNKCNWVIILLVVLAATFVSVVFFTQSSFGGGDHYEHYKLAFHGWKHPRLLFNHWGKPVFTILISPFAQFGINGARIYNVFAGLLTAFLTWKLATFFKMRYAWLTVIFVVFTPIYFATLFTALTEVTFSLFLVFSIYLFFRNHFIFSALVLSFLPLIRTEGIVLLPLFIVAYTLKKKYIALPFLLVGFLLISALGNPFYESFWWLITEMPYTGNAKDLYGSGSLFHFVNHTPNITGGPMAVLFVLGIIVLITSWYKNKENKLNEWFYFVLLIPGSFLVFFAAHSFVWWQGLGNSLGLTRVIASVSPLASLTALFGLQYFLGFNFRYRKIIASIIIITIVFWIIIDGVNKHKYGFKESAAETLLNKAADFIKDKRIDKHKIYYFNGYIIFLLGIDPYEPEKSQQWYNQNQPDPAMQLPDSSIVVWDALFGPNDGGVPLESLLTRDGIVELAVFKPEVPMKVLGGYDYEVIVFQKINATKKSTAYHVREDFEGKHFLKSQKVFSGETSLFVEENRLYYSLCEVKYFEINQKLLPVSVRGSFSILFENRINNKDFGLICSLEQSGKIVNFKSVDSCFVNTSPGKWKTINFNFELPKANNSDNIVKVYFINKAHTSFYVDEIDVMITGNLQNKN